jgi:single-strand DNA-binding protein
MSIAAAFGNVAQNPHISRNPDGKITSAKFTLVEDVYGSRGKSIVYIDCVAFGRTAEIVEQILQKGSAVYIEGSFISGQYKGDNGKTVYTRNLRINRLILARYSSNQSPDNQSTDSSDSSAPEIEREYEPLPFYDEDEIEHSYFED